MRRLHTLFVVFCVLILTAGLIVAQELTQPPDALALTATPTPTVPYDPTLYAIRRTREIEIVISLGPTEYAAFSETEQALITTYAGTPVAPPSPEYTACSWQWHTETLWDLSNFVRISLSFVPGLTPYRASGFAEGFGENCLDTNGNVQYFAIMQTDFVVRLWADEVILPGKGDDLTAYGDILRSVLVALSPFDTAFTPGPMPGRITIEFMQSMNANQSEILHTVRFENYDAVMEILSTLLEENLRGEDVVDLLTEYID